MWPRAIVHLDMDAFYVNVHLLDFPQDRGLPLAVGGRPERRGVVTSASYSARARGVRSAMPMKRAVQLCPNLKIVPPNWPKIRACSREVMDLLRQVGPTEPISVDEAYVALDPAGDPPQQAIALRERVRLETGLPASVGLATSKLVAKVASDFDKPAGCTIVAPGEEADFLAELPVGVLWGVGPRSRERLAKLGIERCGQLANAPLATLQQAFGNQAAALQARAAGRDERPLVSEPRPPKSISQERTFVRDIADGPYLLNKLQDLSETVADMLQRKDLRARTVVVKFRWDDFTTFTRQRSSETELEEGEQIYRLAAAIWQRYWPPGQPVRLLGVGVTNLTPARQLRQLMLDLQWEKRR